MVGVQLPLDIRCEDETGLRGTKLMSAGTSLLHLRRSARMWWHSSSGGFSRDGLARRSSACSCSLTLTNTHRSLQNPACVLGIIKAHLCVPAKKRALEGQDREQTSAPALLVQVSWARGAGFPLGRHFTTSEEHKPLIHHGNGRDKHTHTYTNTHSWCLPTQSFLFQCSFCAGGHTHS